MKRRMVLTLIVAIALLFPASTRAAEPFTINVILSLTGYSAFSGLAEKIGLQALEDVTNHSGGINGAPVHFEILDDASNPATALQLANQIIAKNVSVILGPTLTSNCQAIFPRILDAGPLTYCFSPALYPNSGSYGFSSGPSTRDFNVAAVRYFRTHGWKRIALLTTTDASGQDGEVQARYAVGLPENRGMQIVSDEHFAVTDLSIAAQITRMQAAHPDVVLAWVTGTPSGTALHGMHDAGLNVPVLLNAGNVHVKQIESYADFVPKTLLFPGLLYMAPELAPNSKVKAEQARFLRAFEAQGSPPLLSGALAYDAGRVIVEAFRHRGIGASAAQVRDYVEHVHNLPGVNGILDYTGANQRGIGPDGVIVIQWDETNQSFVPVSRPGGQPK